MNLNKVMLMGNVGRDPESKTNEKTGKTKVQFSLCTNENWMNKKTNEWQSKEVWHNIVANEPVGERIMSKISKGKLVHIIGKIDNYSYTNREGQKINRSEVVVESFQVERDKNGGNGMAQNTQYRSNAGGNANTESQLVEDDVPF